MRLFLVGLEPTYDVDVDVNAVLPVMAKSGKERRRSRDAYFVSHTHDNYATLSTPNHSRLPTRSPSTIPNSRPEVGHADLLRHWAALVRRGVSSCSFIRFHQQFQFSFKVWPW